MKLTYARNGSVQCFVLWKRSTTNQWEYVDSFMTLDSARKAMTK